MSATNHAQEIKNDSKEYLTTALFQLLNTKNLEEIKVTELAKRAGLSRMAFYRNYESVEDVLYNYFEPEIASLFDTVIYQNSSEQKITQLESFFHTFDAPLKSAIKRNYEHIIRKIFTENMIRFYETFAQINNLSTQQKNYWTKFMSAGVYAIWREWILHPDTATLDEIHQLIGGFQNATFASLLVDEN
ncbi:MAG: TetR/AcrR family transcriptional regulator [Enterococcus sp.]